MFCEKVLASVQSNECDLFDILWWNKWAQMWERAIALCLFLFTSVVHTHTHTQLKREKKEEKHNMKCFFFAYLFTIHHSKVLHVNRVFVWPTHVHVNPKIHSPFIRHQYHSDKMPYMQNEHQHASFLHYHPFFFLSSSINTRKGKTFSCTQDCQCNNSKNANYNCFLLIQYM